jgi:PAS domain S-box-containing protein
MTAHRQEPDAPNGPGPVGLKQRLHQAEERSRQVADTSADDIAELKAHERELAEQRLILQTTLDSIDQGIAMVDKDLYTIALNRRLLELLDLPAEVFARGFHMEDAFRFNAERGEYGPGDVEDLVRHRLELAKRFEPHAFEHVRPDGSVIAVRGKPLPGGGFVSTYSDVTEQRRTEKGLKISEERYALATSAVAEGIYEWSIDTGALFLTDHAKSFFSIADEKLTSEVWNRRVHPEDMAGYRAAIADHFRGRTPHLEHEYRVVDSHGAFRWVLDRGTGVRDAGGRVKKVVGALSDITQRKLAEMENVRLLQEVRASLEQQKAASEVLGVISSSIADTTPVFDKIIESCERLFSGRIVGLNLVGPDGLIRIGAFHGEGRARLEEVFPLPVSRESASGLAIVERRIVHYPDIESGEGVPEPARQGCSAIGIKSVIFAPMLWKGRGVGAIFIGRDYVSSFSENEITLLQTFADQAAIAIENVRLFNEIQDKSRQLETASHHKSQFLASMSHELRTPLNAVLGFNEMILGEIYGPVPAEMREPLQDIQSSGKHLLHLINNVLDLAKIEAGRMELALQEYVVESMVQKVRSTLRPLATEKGLDLVVTIPAEMPSAYGDPGRIAQCLVNLTGNSIKFTKTGKVEISVGHSEGWICFRVADTGMGIAPDKIAGLFSEFKQTDATIASEYGGSGLGLSITRRFVEMHGGRIWVESDLGRGSTFAFELPLRLQNTAAA